MTLPPETYQDRNHGNEICRGWDHQISKEWNLPVRSVGSGIPAPSSGIASDGIGINSFLASGIILFVGSYHRGTQPRSQGDPGNEVEGHPTRNNRIKA